MLSRQIKIGLIGGVSWVSTQEYYRRINTFFESRLGEAINKDRILLLADRGSSGYQTDYLNMVLARLGDGSDPNSFFVDRSMEALAISFYNLREATDMASLVSDPVPEVQVLPCPDRKAWARLLWELNQPTADGRKRHTVVIHRPEDILRLQRAILARYVLEINGGGGSWRSIFSRSPIS